MYKHFARPTVDPLWQTSSPSPQRNQLPSVWPAGGHHFTGAQSSTNATSVITNASSNAGHLRRHFKCTVEKGQIPLNATS